jgi:transcriptional regulator with XRE-family HTH domain
MLSTNWKKIALEILSVTTKTLKDLIKEANLTYRSLATKLGTSHDQIVAWNKGDSYPSLPYLVSLSRNLNVPLKVLIGSLGVDVSDLPNDAIASDPNDN